MRATRSTPTVLARLVCVALAVGTPSLAIAQATGSAPAAAEQAGAVSPGRIADQLGVKLANDQPADLVIGTSATAVLADPAKLGAFGLRDARAGARVTIMRVAGDRIRVEIDEFDPVQRTRRVTLRLDGDGRVSVPAS